MAELPLVDNPSLIPYLTCSGSAFFLEISAVTSDLNAEETPLFPFALVSDTGAFSRILGARVISDAGSPLKSVFLVMSRDDYRRLDDGPSSLTNNDIDASWRRAFQNHQQNGLLTTLSAQLDEKGDFVPFQSLFFCKRTKRFFHPPCPQCGHALDLCKNDEVLKKAGLKPYSTSLRRYVSCALCAGKGIEKKTFYSYVSDPSDPDSVKGLAELIMGFDGLKAGDLPCIGCPEHRACYKDKQILSTIIPLAFYPFHMLIVEAASLNAFDFLSLISGESFEELEQVLTKEREFARKGYVSLLKERAVTVLLFGKDERCFLEILYLKLSFLGEVARHILSDKVEHRYPDPGFSLERMWVSIADQSSLLPAYWNFRLQVIDMDPDLSDVFPISGTSYAIHILGLLWYYALLKNRFQDIRAINKELAQMQKERKMRIDGEIFQPENIFWEPRPAPQKFRGLWEKALGLGGAILVDSGKEGFTKQAFWHSYDELRDEIRKELFLDFPVARIKQEAPQEEMINDAQIGLILRQIGARWAQAIHAREREELHGPPGISPSAPSPEIPEDGEATMILSPAKPSLREEAKEEYEETVLLPEQSQQKAMKAAEEEDFSTETIIMQHPSAHAETKEPVAMDQTVIMSPGSSKAAPEDRGQALEKSTEKDLEETVIMGGPVPQKKKPAPKDEDKLAETVILKTDKKK